MAWDKSKPAQNSVPISAELRSNWAALAESLGDGNWVANDDLRIWSAGDTAAPDYWTLSGSGAAVARTGTGLADTTRKVSDFACRVTAGAGAAASLQQKLVPAGASFTRLLFLRNRAFGAGVFVKSANANAVRVGLFDGVGAQYSPYHSGSASGGPDGDGWEWLQVGRLLSGAATMLTLVIDANAGTSFHVSAPTVLFGSLVPDFPHPCRQQLVTLGWTHPGTLVAGANILGITHKLHRPGVVLEADLEVITAPTGQAVIVDFNKNGSSMFTTRPQIAAAALTGSAAPDGTYAQRCLGRNALVRADVDQVGSTAAGADLTAALRVLMPLRPQEPFLGLGEVG